MILGVYYHRSYSISIQFHNQDVQIAPSGTDSSSNKSRQSIFDFDIMYVQLDDHQDLSFDLIDAKGLITLSYVQFWRFQLHGKLRVFQKN